MKDVFIIGSKGIPSNYGGFETFVDKLTFYKQSKEIMYHVACLNLHGNVEEFYYNKARCFNVKVKNIGSAKAILYDIQALSKSIKYIEEHQLTDCVILILACRIGPFLPFFNKKLKDLGVKLYINPDGHEWKRSKWSAPIRAYWKLSEKLMVKHSDMQVCDSLGMQEYIQQEYEAYNPKTLYISYGAEIDRSKLHRNDEEITSFLNEFSVKRKKYYLIVGRFVPENNYETMIREFMKSKTSKDLVIITNVEQNKFYEHLLKATNFTSDMRIKFVGTVYDNELLKKIREEAFAYVHGHEVGGTNPSLLEALSSTDINLLLDVNFNTEVGADGALYFNKDEGNLESLINKTEKLKENEIKILAKKATNIIIDYYSWGKIVHDYEELFCEYEDMKEAIGY
ncbi:MAG: beta 1-4 rhamnosyltransferase Cps2T [Clostridium sp.]|uniref:beta 1-4 rhamnosyltransferase Cps2T n=1 Tax=Clostridium sp. TaxID=1506 RepID=UPI003D6D3E12